MHRQQNRSYGICKEVYLKGNSKKQSSNTSLLENVKIPLKETMVIPMVYFRGIFLNKCFILIATAYNKNND